jgi:glucokinase
MEQRTRKAHAEAEAAGRSALAIDIGGTKTMVGIVDAAGTVRVKRQFATLRDSADHLVACLHAARETIAELRMEKSELLGVGVTVPGLADPKRGVLTYAPYLGWRDLPVRDAFQRLCPNAPVRIANDVNACALGEGRFGAARGCKNLLWVTVSTGIGAGLLVGGSIYEGEHSIAGELGHVVVEWDQGEICSCGNKGCLEAHASGTAITAMGRKWARDNAAFADYFTRRGLDISSLTIAQAAREGSEGARAIYRQAGIYLGRALSYAANLLNPGCIVVGGGVSLSFEWMEPAVREVLRSSVIGDSNCGVPIVPTSLGYDAAFIGAASLIFEERKPDFLDKS